MELKVGMYLKKYGELWQKNWKVIGEDGGMVILEDGKGNKEVICKICDDYFEIVRGKAGTGWGERKKKKEEG